MEGMEVMIIIITHTVIAINIGAFFFSFLFLVQGV